MTRFPTTGSFPFEISEAHNPKVGTLVLTYTPESGGSITGASIHYDPGEGHKLQKIDIELNGTVAPARTSFRGRQASAESRPQRGPQPALAAPQRLSDDT
jgi:hypothetical protein